MLILTYRKKGDRQNSVYGGQAGFQYKSVSKLPIDNKMKLLQTSKSVDFKMNKLSSRDGSRVHSSGMIINRKL